MPVSSIIKELLIKKKITQTELAKKLGTTRQNLNNKMSRNNFTTTELYQISQALNVELLIKDNDGTEYNIKYELEQR